MKKITLTLASISFSFFLFSQGWVANPSNNVIYPINSALGLNPVSIGIGTNIPTEQLHTTAGVRFQGITLNNTLNRILALDSRVNCFGGKLQL